MSAAASTFKTLEPGLHELLDGIHKGQVQLPDFQWRNVWNRDRTHKAETSGIWPESPSRSATP